jgi:hypothetical protein
MRGRGSRPGSFALPLIAPYCLPGRGWITSRTRSSLAKATRTMPTMSMPWAESSIRALRHLMRQDRCVVMREHGGVAMWFRTYFEDEDIWQYFEDGGDGWATRQVDLRGADGRPLTAASLDEVVRIRDGGDRAAMRLYEQQFGVLAETVLDGWRDAPRAEEITQVEFEQLWVRARAALGAST